MTATRRQAREWAIQILTAADLNPVDKVDEYIALCWELIAQLDEQDGGGYPISGKLKAFAQERVVGVLNSISSIDEDISKLLDNWNLYRLGTIERVVLRLGIWEMQNTDIPKAVIINEAVDLANWFSSAKTRTIINGVLDKYAKTR